jgi:N-acylneuraminate cytidylyltransferase
MIAHSIARALESRLFDRVVVSTDDDEIAEVAVRHGAEVPFRRPADLSNDHAATAAVIAHAVGWARAAGLVPDAVCCIYATAPFVAAEDLRRGCELLESGNWRFVFSATTFAFPIFRSFEENESGGVRMFFPEHFGTRSQDLPEALHDAGQFYFGRPDAWCDGKPIFDSTSTIVKLPRWRVQDIDTLEDWHRAEVMWDVLKRQAAGA